MTVKIPMHESPIAKARISGQANHQESFLLRFNENIGIFVWANAQEKCRDERVVPTAFLRAHMARWVPKLVPNKMHDEQ
jgi:hypothetical protein